MSKSKYDNAFNQKVLLEKIDRKVALLKKQQYKDNKIYYEIGEDGELDFTLGEDYFLFLDYVKNVPSLDCGMRLNQSKQRKALKVKDKIGDIVLNGNAIFITLTFTDKTLSKTTEETRRRYVARYLKANSKNYVANIDYGAKKGREHYHALVDKDINFKDWYKYGAIKVERVRTEVSDLERVALYVSKLTNHALKLGEDAPRLIYSRITC